MPVHFTYGRVRGRVRPMQVDWFSLTSARAKIAALPDAIAAAMSSRFPRHDFPFTRDVTVVPPTELEPKIGLGSIEGQAKLLHDLANIELQATELALRTLFEFPNAPHDFRMELAEIALGEGRHLKLCLDAIEALGFKWGDWKVHMSLWSAVSNEDTLLDRILIVHRYLEGSGLDSGDRLMNRLVGVKAPLVKQVVETIVTEEVGHVAFGTKWYRAIAASEGLDPDLDFESRIGRIARLAPKREKLCYELRKRAGFNERELVALEKANAAAFQN